MGGVGGAKGTLPLAHRADSDPSARHALDRDIAALDLEPISHLVAMEQPWSLEKLDAVELEYRCFLQITRDYPYRAIVPSRDCDTYWHAHILTLELYLEHCQRLFGRPLLHYPFSGAMGEKDHARQQARFRSSRHLQDQLINRVLGTHPRGISGDEHEPANPEVPQPGRYPGAAQGA